jgi:molybdopterin-guanine dinucleotide biosynthesis protein A
MNHFAGIVLCGGKSTRMGHPKALLPFGPETMVQRVVRILGEVVSPIVVVAAKEQILPRLPTGVIIARDERPERGPLEGIAAGLAALPADTSAAYITSCDVPLLQPAFVRHLLKRLGEHEAAVPVEERFFHPLSAVYRTCVLTHVQQLLAADQLRPAFLFDRVSTVRVPVEELKTVDPTLSTLQNLNHPGDYLAALATAGYSAPAEILATLNAPPKE